ncbi:MAG: glycosyltransferase family 2 protein [Candidatus Magasanikbacteria bacterium]|nr:glycosyltransferase family 2 protein [Candidatus Magasanikbacteria bacterium]
MVCIIVPAYNEGENIGRVVRGLFEQGWRDVVVVDDGSTDSTATTAREAGATVLVHALNRGQGAALQTGNEYALQEGASYAVHFDGDGQFNPRDIAPALRLIEQENLDIVLGSRLLDNRSRVPWLKRYVILPIGRWINFVFTGLWLSDAHNGFRVISRRALAKIVITEDHMAHNTEITAAIKTHGLRFKEVSVEVTYHEMGQGIAGGLKIISDLVMHKLTR